MKVTPISNYVLLKAKVDPSKIQLKGGNIIFLDTSWQPEKHSAIVCEVVDIPDKLIFGYTGEIDKGHKMIKECSMDWDTDVEVLSGDEVIIHYNAYVTAFGDDKRAFEFDGEEYFFVKYDQIFVAKRRWTATEEKVAWDVWKDSKSIDKTFCEDNCIVLKGKEIWSVIMLNGFVLVQPVEKELKSSTIILPDQLIKSDKKKVRVSYNGENNKSYITDVYCDVDVRAGDVVIVDKNIDIPLEPTEHLTFNGSEEYWRVQKCLIYAKEI
jgi:co-chaperonin GroES (HSP10)